MWSGSIPPAGWAICNGGNGTPDLRGRFIVGLGEGDYSNTGERGGLEEITLSLSNLPVHNHTGTTSNTGNHSHSGSTNTTGNHRHGIKTKQDDWNVSGGSGPSWGADNGGYRAHVDNMENAGNHSHTISTNTTGNHRHTFTTSNTGSGTPYDNSPPYFVLAYIMKL